LVVAEALHQAFAYRLEDRNGHDGFYQSWWDLVGMLLQSRGQWETAERYLGKACARFRPTPIFGSRSPRRCAKGGHRDVISVSVDGRDGRDGACTQGHVR
jgi:hypothetical protein